MCRTIDWSEVGDLAGEGFDLAVFLFSCFPSFAASNFFFLLAQDSFSRLTVMEIDFLTSESPSHRRLCPSLSIFLLLRKSFSVNLLQSATMIGFLFGLPAGPPGGASRRAPAESFWPPAGSCVSFY